MAQRRLVASGTATPGRTTRAYHDAWSCTEQAKNSSSAHITHFGRRSKERAYNLVIAREHEQAHGIPRLPIEQNPAPKLCAKQRPTVPLTNNTIYAYQANTVPTSLTPRRAILSFAAAFTSLYIFCVYTQNAQRETKYRGDKEQTDERVGMLACNVGG